jgi:hypothetical protein
MDVQPHVSSSPCPAVPMPCRTSTCITVIAAALAAAAVSAPAQQDTGGGRGVPAGGQAAVSGTVTDATSGAPIRADTPSSFGELAMYRPGDLYRMEVVGGGRAILAYTTFFAENIARTGYVPPAIDTQISMPCSKGPTLN